MSSLFSKFRGKPNCHRIFCSLVLTYDISKQGHLLLLLLYRDTYIPQRS